MIVSHKNKFVFVHIPKTGGTSIVQALYPYLDPEQDIIIGGHERHDNPSTFSASEYEKNNQLHKHSSAVEIKKVIGQDIWDEYFIFAFVAGSVRPISSHLLFSKLKYTKPVFPLLWGTGFVDPASSDPVSALVAGNLVITDSSLEERSIGIWILLLIDVLNPG